MSQPFVDIIVFGEPLHRHFTSNGLSAPDNPKYIPDYFSVEPRFFPNQSTDINGPERALLPLVKRNNDQYLNSNPEMYRQWTRSVIATTFLNNLMLWNTRLDYPTWQNYSRILTEFGGLNGAKNKILATGDTNLKAAAYIKNKKKDTKTRIIITKRNIDDKK